MVTFFMVIAIVGAVAGGIQLLGTVQYAESAPQQAAGAALAVAYAVLPYCLARAVQGIMMGQSRPKATQEDVEDELKERLRKKREEDERIRQAFV